VPNIAIAVAPISDRKLRRKLGRLAGSAITKVMRPAFVAGCRPIRAAARSRVPVRFGQLKKSIGTRVKVYPRGNAIWAGVGVRLGFLSVIDGKKVDPNKYAHLVEWGTKPHILRGAMHPGAKASHFLRSAFDSRQAQAFSEVARVSAGKLSVLARTG